MVASRRHPFVPSWTHAIQQQLQQNHEPGNEADGHPNDSHHSISST